PHRRGERDDQREHIEFRLKSGRELEHVTGKLGWPTGLLRDPSQPDKSGDRRQGHHREPVDGIDRAALECWQTEGREHGQRWQQRQQLVVFRGIGKQAQQYERQNAGYGERHMQRCLRAPCPHGPSGDRPCRPAVPDQCLGKEAHIGQSWHRKQLKVCRQPRVCHFRSG
ncbi:MAG: hypothetical protein ACK55I_01310, partial [bacterium]